MNQLNPKTKQAKNNSEHRALAPRIPPTQDEIRTQLGWNLLYAARSKQFTR